MDMATQLGILGGLFLIAGVLWFPIAVVASVLIGLGVGCIAYSIGQIVQEVWFK